MIINTGSTLTFLHEGKTHQIHNSHVKFEEVVKLVNSGNLQKAVDLIDLKTVVASAIAGTKATLDGGNVMYNGEAIHGNLAKRIIDLHREGLDAKPLLLFLDNLMENPSSRAVNELYDFLQVANLPITEDGHFLAYKAVRGDYTDIHSGTFDNSVGQVCEMPRNKVDEDKNRTCSAGLHFAAYQYANDFGRGTSRMMILKINPRDVVAIPSDYNNQKGRCCRYEVVEEFDRGNDSLTGKAFHKTNKVSFDEPKVTHEFSIGDYVYGLNSKATYLITDLRDKTNTYEAEVIVEGTGFFGLCQVGATVHGLGGPLCGIATRRSI